MLLIHAYVTAEKKSSTLNEFCFYFRTRNCSVSTPTLRKLKACQNQEEKLLNVECVVFGKFSVMLPKCKDRFKADLVRYMKLDERNVKAVIQRSINRIKMHEV